MDDNQSTVQKPATYPAHPAANIFPWMDAESFGQLVNDIDARGQHEPIVLFDQQVIDGRNRQKACQQLGIQPDYCELDECDDPVAYVLSANLHRRHLSKTQLALVAAKARSFYDEQAKERQKRKPQSVVEKVPQQNGKARDQAGKAIGVSGRYVDLATKVVAKGSPQLQSAVEAGVLSLARAAKATELPQQEQVNAAKRTKDTDKGRKNNPTLKKRDGQQELDRLFAEFDLLSPHSKHAFHKRLLRDETIRAKKAKETRVRGNQTRYEHLAGFLTGIKNDIAGLIQTYGANADHKWLGRLKSKDADEVQYLVQLIGDDWRELSEHLDREVPKRGPS